MYIQILVYLLIKTKHRWLIVCKIISDKKRYLLIFNCFNVTSFHDVTTNVLLRGLCSFLFTHVCKCLSNLFLDVIFFFLYIYIFCPACRLKSVQVQRSQSQRSRIALIRTFVIEASSKQLEAIFSNHCSLKPSA